MFAACICFSGANGHRTPQPRVAIYGATPAGCAAAVAAGRFHKDVSVVLIEPGLRVGGMTSGGLGHTDLGLGGKELGGITREFYERVSAYYGSSKNLSATQCYQVEPHVATAVYGRMLAEANVSVMLGHRLIASQKKASDPATVESLSLEAAEGRQDGVVKVTASVFVDASYEGDLMASAGVSYIVGRESQQEYGEVDAGRLAPNNVLSRYQFQQRLNGGTSSGKVLPFIYAGPIATVGAADQKVQAYTFRPCMSKLSGGGAVAVPPPRAYDPLQWELFRRLLAASPDAQLKDYLYFAGPLGNSSKRPNGAKYDVGTNGPISLDLIGGSWEYPEANASARAQIVDAHVQYCLGFWHFLATDAAVPAAMQNEMRDWGLCEDEFAGEEPAHFPRSALYVREARRMRSQVVITAHDRLVNTSKADSVGLGSYNCDCHMNERIIAPPIHGAPSASSGEGGGGDSNGELWVLNEGWLTKYFPHMAWELPYAMMVPPPSQANNLLVPVAVSASHVAFNGVRLEPTWSVLGHAAGVAAAMAATNSSTRHAVAEVDVPQLQALLVAAGQLVRKEQVQRVEPSIWCG